MPLVYHSLKRAPQEAGEPSTVISGADEWHGVYRHLLFQCGPVNPPCLGQKDNDAGRKSSGGEFPSGCNAAMARLAEAASVVQDSQLSEDTAALVQDFLSDSPKVRCQAPLKETSGRRDVQAFGESLKRLEKEPKSFSCSCKAKFEESEDSEDVVMALCKELTTLFDAYGEGKRALTATPIGWTDEGVNALASLLLRILPHRDRELRESAQQAFTSLLAVCGHSAALKRQLMLRVLDLCGDGRDAFRLAAASLLPATLHCARRCCMELAEARGSSAQVSSEATPSLHALRDLKQKLLAAYLALCGDKDCAVQLTAGQQLPRFVDFVAAEIETLQQEQPPVHAPAEDAADGAAAAAEDQGKIGELMIALYTATQKFTLSLHESCRMQAVSAVAAMALRNAAVFKALGSNFFPMLCSDSSWRVRATVCLALEDLSRLFYSPTTMANAAEDGMGTADAAVTGDKPASRMPPLLFKFLTDRSPMVKLAALQVLPRVARIAGTAGFVRDAWMLELHKIAEDDGANPISRLPGACLDAVLALLPLASGAQRRALMELAMQLVRRGNWKLRIAFLGAMGAIITSEEVALVSPMILSEEFVKDEDGDDCWRIHAAIAQQLPVLMRARFEKQEGEAWWRRCSELLLHSAWAVRQEAGFALPSLLKVGLYPVFVCIRKAATQNGLENEEHHAREQASVAPECRVFRALQQVAACKNAFIRQDLAFYLHVGSRSLSSHLDQFIPAPVQSEAALSTACSGCGQPGVGAPLCLIAANLEHSASRKSADPSLAVATVLAGRLSAVLQSELSHMLEELSCDKSIVVREEVSSHRQDILEPSNAYTIN
ncbi:hypothetical protein cyc_07267 [Cyclospora cayetanensis]|uniref:HEAT repeat-containing protein n=1 Tax=Cyclospora cayetanensis TaxID=88456 RepID=A0A1D3D2T7_9EIME|nr:hypothetical protein cyc_07267 [Cyclospora cayetanensis]